MLDEVKHRIGLLADVPSWEREPREPYDSPPTYDEGYRDALEDVWDQITDIQNDRVYRVLVDGQVTQSQMRYCRSEAYRIFSELVNSHYRGHYLDNNIRIERVYNEES